MAQGIYDLLQETLKLTTNLNKQLCCEPTPPPTTTTTSSTTTTTSSTTTTTTIPTTRRAWLISLDSALRSGSITDRPSWYGGNTIASIGASNPDFTYVTIVGNNSTGGLGLNNTRILRETNASPAQTVTPDYVTFDGVTGFPIMTSLKDMYRWVSKIVNNTFLATRNPSIFIKRVLSPNGAGTGIPLDGLFLIGVDFDTTGNERDGYDIKAQNYNFLSIPGTLNLPLPYNSYYGGMATAANPNLAMGFQTVSTSWVNGSTNIIGTIIQENFVIPPGW